MILGMLVVLVVILAPALAYQWFRALVYRESYRSVKQLLENTEAAYEDVFEKVRTGNLIHFDMANGQRRTYRLESVEESWPEELS